MLSQYRSLLYWVQMIKKENVVKSARIGIIGGSGLYEMENVEVIERCKVETPFGEPSDEFILGKFEGREVVFLARHGKGHRCTPSEINYRANIFGMKSLGVEQILSVSAVGSLKEEIAPGHLVFIDQFIDRTTLRKATFFGDGIVAHVPLAEPICSVLRKQLSNAAQELKYQHHDGGIYICMEGPQFSTKAESNLYRSWGADVIGMTNLTEAKLAREAQICYSTLALSTDYDCWHADHDSVTTEQVMATMAANIDKAKKIIKAVVPKLALERSCGCARVLQNAVVTDRLSLSTHGKKILNVLSGK